MVLSKFTENLGIMQMAMKSTTVSLFKDVCLDAVGRKPLRVLYHLIPNGKVHLCSIV